MYQKVKSEKQRGQIRESFEAGSSVSRPSWRGENDASLLARTPSGFLMPPPFLYPHDCVRAEERGRLALGQPLLLEFRNRALS